MIYTEKCASCANEHPGIECINCGTKHRNYRPNDSYLIKRKPLKDWTLEDLHTYCDKNIGGDCEYCDAKRLCDLYVNADGTHICVPRDWDLAERPRFTAQDAADARSVLRVVHRVSENAKVQRDKNGWLWIYEYGLWEAQLNRELFPDLGPGEEAVLVEILEAGEA